MIGRKSRKRLFERLHSSLAEGIRFTQGELSLRTTVIPAAPPEVGAQEIRSLRNRFAMSQSVLAGLLNVSTKTVQSWEQGLRKPSQAALRLIQVLRARPELIRDVLTPTERESGAKKRRSSAKAR